jgi:hypothetical protein
MGRSATDSRKAPPYHGAPRKLSFSATNPGPSTSGNLDLPFATVRYWGWRLNQRLSRRGYSGRFILRRYALQRASLDRGQDAVVAGYWLSAGRFNLASRDLRFDARRGCQLQLMQTV